MTAMPHKTYFIRTFGCQMNEHDSGKMASLLEGCGYRAASSMDDADVILFNTCTIREKAYHKAESEIGRALLYKRKRGSRIGVCGCVAQQEGTDIRRRFEHIDFVLGPDQLSKLLDLIESAEQGTPCTALDFIDDPHHPAFPHNIAAGTVVGGSAFVAISKGCDSSCSYCIVPKVRGREVSRPWDDILAEVRELSSRGAVEITLLGQNVNSYGGRLRRSDGSTPFTMLIRRIAEESDVKRIRFTSPHPRDVSQDLINLYGEQNKLCPHLHLPVQAGSDSVLKRMRRGYTRRRFLEIVEGLRSARPGISITTDMIVGFCGETAEDFDDSIQLMEQVRFDSMFAFCYSPRPGTHAAAELDDDVPMHEKRRRLELVLDLQRRIQLEKNEAQVGRTVNVLVIEKDGRDEDRLSGRAEDNRLIHFAGHEGLIGSIVPVKIIKASMHSLQGELSG